MLLAGCGAGGKDAYVGNWIGKARLTGQVEGVSEALVEDSAFTFKIEEDGTYTRILTSQPGLPAKGSWRAEGGGAVLETPSYQGEEEPSPLQPTEEIVFRFEGGELVAEVLNGQAQIRLARLDL